MIKLSRTYEKENAVDWSWVLVIFLLIVTALFGYGFFVTLKQKEITRKLLVTANRQLNFVLRREVANELLRRDVNKYKDNFKIILERTKLSLEGKSFDEKTLELRAIQLKWQHLEDFDILGTREYLLYEHGFKGISDSELWDFYESVILQETMLLSPYSESVQCKHLLKYCEQIEDSRLLVHLYRARDEFLILDNIDHESESEMGKIEWETSAYKFWWLSTVPYEIKRIGVYVKEMNRYGTWSHHDIDDDNIGRTLFQAADKDFNESTIDCLDISINIDKKEYSCWEKINYN